MVYIAIGIIGFGLLLVADVCGIKKKQVCGFLSAFSGTFLLLISSIYILTLDYKYQLHFAVRGLGLVLAILFLLLMIYSIVIEVSRNNAEKRLITSGTYALNRHPGVLWFFLYYVFGSLFFQDYLILIAGITWSLVNVIYVYLQERLIFNQLFDNYEEYKQSTPMILPNKNSLSKCIQTINGGKHEELTRNA